MQYVKALLASAMLLGHQQFEGVRTEVDDSNFHKCSRESVSLES